MEYFPLFVESVACKQNPAPWYLWPNYIILKCLMHRIKSSVTWTDSPNSPLRPFKPFYWFLMQPLAGKRKSAMEESGKQYLLQKGKAFVQHVGPKCASFCCCCCAFCVSCCFLVCLFGGREGGREVNIYKHSRVCLNYQASRTTYMFCAWLKNKIK